LSATQHENVTQWEPLTLTFNVYLDPNDSGRMLLWSNDPQLTDAHGAKPGIKLCYSTDPDSADYSPANYNRLLRWLHRQGKYLDVVEVPEHSRRLMDRWGLLSLAARRRLLGRIASH